MTDAKPPLPLLEVTDLSVRYGRALGLECANLRVEHGSAVAVLGPNGAGKSTLARAISGLVSVGQGSITYRGSRIDSWKPHRIRQAGIVYLPEGRGIFPELSVGENLQMAVTTLARSQRRAAVDRAYDLFPALQRHRRQAAGTLSGGEQQMVSLARGLALSPTLIIADELSLGLAPMMVDTVFEGLRRAHEAGIAILLVEQFVHRALDFADQCVVLSRGKTVWSGTPQAAGTEMLGRYLGVGAL